MKVSLAEANAADATAIAELHTAVADRLTQEFGHGHWSSHVSEKGCLVRAAHFARFRGEEGVKVVGTLRLATTKPWAIDKSYFTKCERPLYLTAMAVEPSLQRKGIGRAMLDDAKRIARAWPGDAIRLDAYDYGGRRRRVLRKVRLSGSWACGLPRYAAYLLRTDPELTESVSANRTPVRKTPHPELLPPGEGASIAASEL